MRKVLAQLGRVDSGGGGKLLAGHRRDPAVGQRIQGSQVDRQPRDRGIGDAVAGQLRGCPPACVSGWR